MGLVQVITASLIAAGVTGGALASPAAATDEITENAVGTYEVHYSGTSSAIWVATPCDDDADQCIQISEYGSKDTSRKNPRWTSKAFWSVGSWIMVPVPDQQRECNEGMKFFVTYEYSWDAASYTGWRSYFDPAVCPSSSKPKSNSSPFSLTKVGPPPSSP